MGGGVFRIKILRQSLSPQGQPWVGYFPQRTSSLRVGSWVLLPVGMVLSLPKQEKHSPHFMTCI